MLIKRNGIVFILSSPSGAGKTTLSRMLMDSDDNLVMSISATTRPKRDSEQDGVDYYFISEKEFDKVENEGGFLESADVFGYRYGTPAKKVKDSLADGKDIIFDIDWQGTEQLTNKCREDVVSVFILPPSMHELERRLRNRAQDSEEVIQKRMSKASNEISHWDSYDYVIINDNMNQSLEKIISILKAERLKRKRRFGLNNFVNNLLKDNH